MLRRTLTAVAGLIALPAAMAALPGTASAAPAGGSPLDPTAVAGAPSILWTTAGEPAAAKAAARPAAAAPGASTAPNPNALANNLIYHGGAVLHQPHVYVTFWGSGWDNPTVGKSAQGTTYTPAQMENYVTTFFANIGGTYWHGVQSQFCDAIAAGATDCTSATSPAQFVQNEKDLLKGVWVDDNPIDDPPPVIATTALAEQVTTDPVATEAQRSAVWFSGQKGAPKFPGGYDPEGVYFVFAQPGVTATAYGTVYCAYHNEIANQKQATPPTVPVAHGLKYSFMPFDPEQGTGCGAYYGNKTDDAFGHGYADSLSEAGGHEFEETVTDPDAFPTQDGWNDASTSENGDKCAYFEVQDISTLGGYWAVQPMWSNEANNGTGGCAFSRGTGLAGIPPTQGVVGGQSGPGSADNTPPAATPEAPLAVALPALPIIGGLLFMARRRRRSTAA